MPSNILIVRFSSIGDILLTTPLLRALRLRHPDATITFVTKAGFAPLLEHNPRVTRVIGWEPATGLGPLARELRAGEFTHRLDLHGSLRSRILRWKVGGGGRWTGYPKHRFARAVLIRTKRNIYRDRRPVAERYFDAARRGGLDVAPDEGSLEIFLPRPTIEAADRFLSERGLGGGWGGARRQVIALAPGASQFTKRWPVHHWIALSRRLVELGNDVVVLGGEMDRRLAEGTVRSVRSERSVGSVGSVGSVEEDSRVVNAAGLDLPTTGALLKRCRALIAGDTGQMHLATAVGTPVIALFGPTVEAFGFFPYHAKATVLQRELPCRPCSAQGGPTCPLKHHRCLQDLQPSQVLEALRKLPR